MLYAPLHYRYGSNNLISWLQLDYTTVIPSSSKHSGIYHGNLETTFKYAEKGSVDPFFTTSVIVKFN